MVKILGDDYMPPHKGNDEVNNDNNGYSDYVAPVKIMRKTTYDDDDNDDDGDIGDDYVFHHHNHAS